MKRPFSITEEPRRTTLVDLICKFVLDNSKVVRELETDYKQEYKLLSFVCPCCKKEYLFRAYLFDCEEKEYKENIFNEKSLYWFGYEIIKLHLANQIRMHGSKDAMDTIVNIFGKNQGKEVLMLLFKKNILATQLICSYINNLNSSQNTGRSS